MEHIPHTPSPVRPRKARAIKRLAAVGLAAVTLGSLAAVAPSASTAASAATTAYSADTSWIGGGSHVNARRSPDVGSALVRAILNGQRLSIDCQLTGGRLGFSRYADNRTWNRLTDGTYVHDALTSTPGGPRTALPDGGYAAWSTGIPRCPTPPASSAPAAPAAPSTPSGVTAYATTTHHIGGGSRVNVRTGTSTSSGLAYSLPTGRTLSIQCQLVGGRLGFSRYADNRTWNRLTDGRYVHDVLTTTPGSANKETQSDGGYASWSSSIPRCSGGRPAPAPAQQGLGQRETRAVDYARSQVGVTTTPETLPAGVWSGFCEKFVEIAFGTRGIYDSASDNYRAQLAAGRIRTDTNPPAGALVFYDWAAPGHVGISLGNGQVISTQGSSGARPVAEHALLSGGMRYLGWAPAPDAWRGR